MNKVTVNIQGLEYTLKGEESEEHLNEIGKRVDELLSTMMKSNRKLNISTAAILTSCNLIDENMKLEAKMTENAAQDSVILAEKSVLEKEIKELKGMISLKEKTITGLAKEESTELKKKDEDIRKLQSEVQLLQESVKEYRDDNEQFSKINKELKFELQSYKYKVLDLQNKLFENQMNIAKDKKDGAAKLASNK